MEPFHKYLLNKKNIKKIKFHYKETDNVIKNYRRELQENKIDKIKFLELKKNCLEEHRKFFEKLLANENNFNKYQLIEEMEPINKKIEKRKGQYFSDDIDSNIKAKKLKSI